MAYLSMKYGGLASMYCCALAEARMTNCMPNLHSVQKIIDSILAHGVMNGITWVIFTVPENGEEYNTTFKEYVEKLPATTFIERVKNPNSGNFVNMYCLNLRKEWK
jgi:hypothetical protein